MTTLHKYADVLQDLQALVKERGEDFVYTPRTKTLPTGRMVDSCLYVHEGQGDCGLGKVFAEKWAVPLPGLVRVDEGYDSITDVLGIAGHDLTQMAALLAFDFQQNQDNRAPYGQALRDAVATTLTRNADDTVKAEDY